jgi:Flp pilus assembly protein TadG
MMKRKIIRGENGTSLIEFSMVLRLILITLLGLVEVSYALLDQHIVTKLTREGSNLISRDTDLPTAANVLKGMSTRPVNFDDGSSKVIFSVIKNVSTTSATNYNQPVVYARYVGV